jgi:hypothetical protein
MSKLTEFIIKRLQENIKQRWVVESSTFFELLENMGIINDEDLLTDIFEFLETENIDINFKSTGDQIRFQQYKRIEEKAKFVKRLGIAQDGIRNFIGRVDNAKPSIDDSFMKVYMTDNDDELKEVIQYINNQDDNLERFRQKFQQEKYLQITEELNKITNDELINQITNK